MGIGVYNPRNFPFLDPPQISIPCVLPRNLHNSLRPSPMWRTGVEAWRRGGSGVGNECRNRKSHFLRHIHSDLEHPLLTGIPNSSTTVATTLPDACLPISKIRFSTVLFVRSAAEVGLMMRPPGTYVKELRRDGGGGSSTLRSSKK